MTDEITPTKKELQKPNVVVRGGGADSVYGIGLIGAWVYYFKRATTTQERVQAFFKGLFWPGFLVYDLFEYLHKE
jgi:hypothetical protein